VRVFIGKSETALLYGHPASALSAKIAIADCCQVQEELGIEIFPIFGGGALPFRGHITLENIDRILEEYRGARTYTVQSGMRYDHGPEKTLKLIDKIKSASNKKFLEFDEDERRLIIQLITIFAKNYLLELSEIAEKVSKIATFIPNQRDRILSSEQVAYYRNLKNVVPLASFCVDTEVKQTLLSLDQTRLLKLPRVIKFTAALYTCGMPPEFIGTGNALKEIKEKLGQECLEKFLEEIYPLFEEDLKFASKFLNLNPNENLLLTNRISQSIENLKPYVQFEEPDSGYMILNRVATTYIKDLLEGKKVDVWKLAIQIYPNEVAEYLNGSAQENLSKLILDMGKLRGSLG
jgi:phosphoenolpyruvate carboxylase